MIGHTISHYRILGIVGHRVALVAVVFALLLVSALAQQPSNGSLSNTAEPTPSERPRRVAQGVSEVLLIKKVKPKYPKAARAAGIQGSVVLQIVVDSNGKVKNLKPVSGDPSLTPAAVDAVKKWKYRPYVLNGQRVEMETQVVVAFKLK